MTAAAATEAALRREGGRPPSLLVGAWEVGLLCVMVALYLAGLYLNPAFFGSTDALFSVLRDASRYGVMAVGMTFVIVNKELDLSVGSTFGLTATVFGVMFGPTYFNYDITTAVLACLALGVGIGLINGVLVTILEVPAFIATLTMLFIGRGVILGLTGAKNIAFEIKADGAPDFFRLGDVNSFGFNNQIIVFAIIAAVGAVTLAYTSVGWTTYATGGNEQATRYSGVNTRFVRMRSYLFSSLCAVIAGLMNVAQSKDADPQFGIGSELVVIASVIVGGAAIFGGRGRVIGSCMGAIFVGLVDKVLREGVPIVREIDVGGEKMQVAAVAQLPPGAVPAVLGVVLVLAVLIEPWIVRRRVFARAWAYIRRAPPPANSRSRRRRFGGRADARHDGAGARIGRERDRRLLLSARRSRDHAGSRALAVRSVGPPGFLGQSRQFVRDPVVVLGNRAAHGRTDVRDGQRRHRSVGRLRAGALRSGRRRCHERYGPWPVRGRRARHRRRRVRRRRQRLVDGLCRASLVHRDARHVLLGAWRRLLDRVGHSAQWLSGTPSI